MILIGLLGQADCASDGRATLASAAVPACTRVRRESFTLMGFVSVMFLDK
jgi:hypothetical protein